MEEAAQAEEVFSAPMRAVAEAGITVCLALLARSRASRKGEETRDPHSNAAMYTNGAPLRLETTKRVKLRRVEGRRG